MPFWGICARRDCPSEFSGKDSMNNGGRATASGDMGLLDDLPRSATAHVLETAEALSLSRERLQGMLLAYPELGIGMLAALSLRLREANEARVQSQQGAEKRG